ncbi:hypothetical protein ABZ897_60345 [Nonomuraea sp. NPDC046802]|uniref:hypothetical protein n=1 Tax=Nonomuraea sp. NPDC046802 TaxID=3154919 RepID=UPI0033E7F5FB
MEAGERDLISEPVTPADRDQPDRQKAEAARRAAETVEQEAARREAWPMLHDVPDGGTVNLGDVWHRLGDERFDIGSYDLVELLAERAGGVARRLGAGVRSLRAGRDGNTFAAIDLNPVNQSVEVVAWLPRGCRQPDRGWWVRCAFEVDTDEDDEVFLTPIWGTEFAVCGRGGSTVFHDPQDGPLGRIVGRWYLEWLGRGVVREELGLVPVGPARVALPLKHFLTRRMQLFSLEIVHGERPPGRVRFGDAECPIAAADLPDKVLGWMAAYGALGGALDVHVLVTAHDQRPAEAAEPSTYRVLDTRVGYFLAEQLGEKPA